MFCYREPLWNLQPDIISFWNVAAWNLRSCICGAPSLTRGRVCNLQCNHWMVRVAQNPWPDFAVSSETPQVRLLYDWRSVSQYVLVSSTFLGLAIKYYFLSECCCLKFAVLFLWGALFDDRRRRLLYDWRSVSQWVCLGTEHPCGAYDHILLPVGRLLSEGCGILSVGRPLWREDESAVFIAVTQWSKSLRTRNHTLLSHPRHPQPGGPGSRICITQEQGGPVILRALGSLYVASYDSQGYRWGILTNLNTGCL
jgi:hypothetical protein